MSSLNLGAGVRPDISERVLGHPIVGVEGVYDRHSYAAEKTDALNKLAGLVASLVQPPEQQRGAHAHAAVTPMTDFDEFVKWLGKA